MLANVSDFAYVTRDAHRDGDRQASADRDRRAGRQSLSRGPPSRHRRRDDAAHPAGEPLRDRGDDAERGRPRARDAAGGDIEADRPRPGILYTSNGTDHPPAVLGTVEVDPSAISYFDGFFASPTQVLARVKPEAGRRRHDAVRRGTGARRAHVVRRPRRRVDAGGRARARWSRAASTTSTRASRTRRPSSTSSTTTPSPTSPLLQPRLGSVEEWSFVNNNNDEHPIHIHVNDFQVMEHRRPGVREPRPACSPGARTTRTCRRRRSARARPSSSRARSSLRSEFIEFTGAYVVHCHRLNHEDNGLMALVNVIPAVSSFAVAASGAPGSDASVRVYDGSGDAPLATVDAVPRLRRARSASTHGRRRRRSGARPRRRQRAGRHARGRRLLRRATRRRRAVRRRAAALPRLRPAFSGGVSVAAAGIDGNALADNVIVGSGAGHRVDRQGLRLDAAEPARHGAGRLRELLAVPGRRRPASAVAAGLVDAVSGRSSIVTAPGRGQPGRRSRRSASTSTGRTPARRHGARRAIRCRPDVPRVTSDFLAFDGALRGRRLALDRLDRGGALRRRAVDRRRAGRRPRHRQDLLERLRARRRSPTVYLKSPDEHDTARHVPRDRELRAVRGRAVLGRPRRDHQHRPAAPTCS